jgi:branched-chain amino acid transport system ATP-binding protein
MTAPRAISTSALAKRFGGVVATNGVDLSIPRGEIRCIIGPNGAGKSTLFALLGGIHAPDAGRILLGERDVTRLPAFHRVRSGLGLTFQTNRAYHNLTITQNLDIAQRSTEAASESEALRRYSYALSLFQLDQMGALPARELPHHKLQWLEIAMVLAGGPEIVLLDEPTAGMSPEETMQTADVLRQLNRMGLTIVVVEHDIAFVREVAQYVTVLHQGRIFAEGTVAEITAHEDVRNIYLGRA